MTKSALESQLAYMIRCVGLPEPKTQYRLPEVPERRHLWDFAWPCERLLVDVQGAIWVDHKGHNSGAGVTRDCTKLNLATLAGYRCLFVTSNQIDSGEAVQWIERALKVVQESEI